MKRNYIYNIIVFFILILFSIAVLSCKKEKCIADQLVGNTFEITIGEDPPQNWKFSDGSEMESYPTGTFDPSETFIHIWEYRLITCNQMRLTLKKHKQGDLLFESNEFNHFHVDLFLHRNVKEGIIGTYDPVNDWFEDSVIFLKP